MEIVEWTVIRMMTRMRYFVQKRRGLSKRKRLRKLRAGMKPKVRSGLVRRIYRKEKNCRRRRRRCRRPDESTSILQAKIACLRFLERRFFKAVP